MKLRTLLIDDEPIALEKLRSYSSKVPFLEIVGACRNGIEATEKISHEAVDVVFTDINMPDMSGLDFISSLPNPPLVVFITAYTDYAVDSYRLSAIDYLLKPYGFADFQRAANKALEQHNFRAGQQKETPLESSSQNRVDTSLFVKVDYKYVRVDISDIRYIKGCGEYLQIFTVNSVSPLMTLSSFSALMSRLPDNFLQVHRSYAVNMSAIQSITKNRISMGDDTSIPVGDSYKDALQSYLSTHSIGKIH
ncbi:MAG: LytTR family DNA-binding domain-containing protein [Muribaculaceae bacterium]|nr:LytTR family DNA-binding domain-containing protein [Muribaculaceae bacterium]